MSTLSEMSERILEGIRVLDVSQFLSGPRAGQLLAEMGAEVIKVEPPAGETLRMLTMLMPGADRILSILNRNKKGITLDLGSEKGKEIFLNLIKISDVVIENNIPGKMDTMGLGYQDLSKVNPVLIYGAISGFGQTGPRAKLPAFDIIAQATAGIMEAYRQRDKPPGTFMADLVSGAYLALGVLGALFQRQRTGKGQMVDISMQDVMYVHNFPAMSRRALEPIRQALLESLGKTPEGLLTDMEKGVPFWNAYQARDGYVVVVALTEGQWRRMWKALGKEEMLQDDRFSNVLARFLNADAYRETLQDWIREHTVDEVVSRLIAANVPCGEVKDSEQVNKDPQLDARGMFCKIPHPQYGLIDIPGPAIKLSHSPCIIEKAAPALGEHNEEIFCHLLGYSPEELAAFRKKGIC